MRLWLVPVFYVGGTLLLGMAFLRFEHQNLAKYFPILSDWYFANFSISSAQAALSAIASGMMAQPVLSETLSYTTRSCCGFVEQTAIV
jgi:hypothetical protein